MKPYRLYWQCGARFRKFARRSRRLGIIPHDYDTFNEALEQIKQLWKNDPNTQYVIIDYSKEGRSQIVALNMPEIHGPESTICVEKNLIDMTNHPNFYEHLRKNSSGIA